jgi:ribA/ribD-fused uncharacterized protein
MSSQQTIRLCAGKNNKPCSSPGKYRINGQLLCGRHAPMVMRTEENRLSSDEMTASTVIPPRETSAIRFYDTIVNQYRSLGNYEEVPFSFEHNSWRTVEHAYQSIKFIYFTPHEELANKLKFIVSMIAKAESAFEARTIGEAHKEYVRGDWNSKYSSAFTIGDRYMFQMIGAKLDQHKNIAKLLLDTGDQDIVNVSSDQYWGQDDDGNGQNMLGKFLIGHRIRLRQIS